MQRIPKQKGFTLIELMVVVAVIAILGTIAVNSYRGNVVRANRAAAVGFVLEVANAQERYFLDNRSYAIDSGSTSAIEDTLGMAIPDEVADNYTLTVTDPAGSVQYLISAAPKGAQASDDSACGTLTLNNQGAKTDAGGDRCWK
ncbi:type IV pilin protein [Litorivivens sp.]|uniref:type IV pilin protein n=1 Tax=Litorivivens sp. TaxID=2020868 RepID=UPI0035694773